MIKLLDTIHTFGRDYHPRLTLFLATTIYLLGEAIYNAYFHPLADVPGPFWCKVSSWPSYLHARTGSRHIWIWQNHQIYGDRFRYKPNGVLIASPKGYRDIYNAKANVKKAKWYAVWQRRHDELSTLSAIDPHKHMLLRRPLNNAFSEKSLRSSEPYIIKHIDKWIELLLDGEKTKGMTEWATPKNLGGEWADYLIFDILCDLCFGKSFETIEPESPVRQIPHIIGEYLHLMNTIAHAPFRDCWVWLKPRGLDKALSLLSPKNVVSFYQFLGKCVAEREEQEKTLEKEDVHDGRKDIFHYLYQAKKADNALPSDTKGLFASANLLVTAGSDTTATALCSALFYLTRNEHAYNKLAKEIRDTFLSVEDIHGGHTLSNCQYLHAVCLEAMRMAPSAPSELARQVLPGGHTINEQYYTEGTEIGASNYSANYHEDTYGDPFVFRPERWISNKDAGITVEQVAVLKEAFSPFSIGPSQCPGKNLALLEMYIVLGRMIHACDIRRSVDDVGDRGAGSPELIWGRRNTHQYQVRDAFLGLRNGPVVQLCRRVKV
ncbi:uncharacterized protein EAE98_006726 [Botrytis deweyae]|uniref:Benzoate 4-monooxygenase cytochrome P450 n=1 Tax=Botrytis deweyae TaxID=2478750 RepID=A0ABQ7IIJ3_9HELO|nr:uncharacterized protein EAE98_006726 [Botrytis deweyae]KAF7925501.1 hypothetical protein EAE98_006726 [Botrytis deweyae]